MARRTITGTYTCNCSSATSFKHTRCRGGVLIRLLAPVSSGKAALVYPWSLPLRDQSLLLGAQIRAFGPPARWGTGTTSGSSEDRGA